MKNFRQVGDTVYVPAPLGGVKSGDFIIVEGMFGVCSVDADAGKPLALAVTGIFSLPKTAGTAWSPGDLIYWDVTAKECIRAGAASGDLLIGVATALAPGYTAAAASADTVGDVRLNGSF